MFRNISQQTNDSGQAFVCLLSDEVVDILLLVNYVCLCGVISLFGVCSNLSTIAVFAKQGFKDSINISLLGLAIADLACSITMLWTSICFNPLFQSSGLPIVYLDIMYVTGGWPHVCFNRITSFITVFITLERCLCVTLPLKVKNIITPLRTKIIILTIFISVLVMFSPVYCVNKLGWGYNQLQNRTLLSLYFTEDRQTVESITFYIHSVTLPSFFLLSVIVCTTVLVVKLKHKSKWRKTSVSNTPGKQDISSVKDKQVVKMITLIATIFIVCYTPQTVIFLFMVSFPEFNVAKTLENVLFVTWSGAFVLQIVNSSVNIFVYFKMSTKFRQTFVKMFCRFVKL